MFNVNAMSIKIFSKPSILTYNKNAVEAQFIFSSEWVGEKTAIFEVDGVSYAMLINENNRCDVPEECYRSKNYQFRVGVICGDLVTTNYAVVTFNESCYTPNVSITQPSDDVYTQIIKSIDDIKEKVDSVGIGEISNEQLANAIAVYFAENPISSVETSSTFVFKVNGGQTHWDTNDTSTCYKVENVNTWNFIPCKLSPWLAVNNSHDLEYYCNVTNDGKGVQFVENITRKIKKVSTSGNFFGQSQNWIGISLKVIASTLNTTDAQKKSDYTYLNENVVAIFNDDLPAGNIKRHKSFAGIDFVTEFQHKDDPNAKIVRDNMVINCLMWSGSQDDYISDESYIMITFYDL